MEGNRITKKVLYMDLETKRLRGRPRNRWQDEVREDGRLVGGRKGYITERNVQRMEGNRITKKYYIWIWKQRG
jgi:hypothetical protein